MADDNTTIFTPPELVGDPEHTTSNWQGMSGRFWIALTSMLGLIITTILVMSGFVRLESNIAVAVYTSFAATAGAAVTTYMGQNKQSAQVNGK
jgi:hypothetical protein